jgi:hypothetical protein
LYVGRDSIRLHGGADVAAAGVWLGEGRKTGKLGFRKTSTTPARRWNCLYHVKGMLR